MFNVDALLKTAVVTKMAGLYRYRVRRPVQFQSKEEVRHEPTTIEIECLILLKISW